MSILHPIVIDFKYLLKYYGLKSHISKHIMTYPRIYSLQEAIYLKIIS